MNMFCGHIVHKTVCVPRSRITGSLFQKFAEMGYAVLGGSHLGPWYCSVPNIAAAHTVMFRVADGCPKYFHHIFFGEMCPYFLMCTDKNIVLIRFPGIAQSPDGIQVHEWRIYFSVPARVQEAKLIEWLTGFEDGEFFLWFVLLTHQKS
jgi:hypothetical protein